ncbi:MAG: sensor histidine kinase [Persicimonas sp.]
MSPLYAYSLVPVLCVALLLFFTAALRADDSRGLAAYCLATAVWALSLLFIFIEPLAWLGRHLAASGAFVVAAYLHAAYEFTERRSYRLVWFAYAAAAVFTAVGAIFPGVLYDPVNLSAGPYFWETMALAMGAASVPMIALGATYRRESDPQRRRQVAGLLLAGLLGYAGAWTNAVLLAYGEARPWGLWGVLASLFVLAGVVRMRLRATERRVMERSLSYGAMTAFLSAGFLFGVVTLMSESGEPLIGDYRLGALFLAAMAALAFEPLRQHLQEVIGRRVFTDQAATTDLAEALADREKEADQAKRLAELGTFTSAIAHEVRNPLGVLSACLKVVERADDVDEETVAEMRDQIERASDFLDELLAYGRPRELELRTFALSDVLELAYTSARRGLDGVAEDVELELDLADGPVVIEADQSQLTQVFVILFENALLALDDHQGAAIRVGARQDEQRVVIELEDDGPGLPEELEGRLFEPFVTGRKRDGPKTGTGLGLAIARRIVERHDGAIEAGASDELGGARFRIELPLYQNVLAAAAGSPSTQNG